MLNAILSKRNKKKIANAEINKREADRHVGIGFLVLSI